MEKINVLIVEDHALTRFALSTSLKDEEFTNHVFEADCARSAYEIVKNKKVDLVLMDLGLPEISGVRASIEIKKRHPDIKIVIITSHADEREVDACLETGISAYCSKDIEPEKLMEIIKDVMEGAVWFDPSVSSYVLQKAAGAKHKHDPKDKYGLTAKELKVLSLLADGNSNNEIAKKMDVSINTIKVHMCSILQKLVVDDRTQAAIKAIKENLI